MDVQRSQRGGRRVVLGKSGLHGTSGTPARRGVLVYLRVSTEEQAQSGNSLAEQERRIREKFEGRLGLPVLGVYADEGASAYKDDERREQFWRMIERAKSAPQVGIIAVDEESRFYRTRFRAAALKGGAPPIRRHGASSAGGL